MRMIALMVAVAGLLLAADDPARSELGTYQRTWVLVSEEFEGQKVPANTLKDLSYTVRGDKVRYSSNGKDRSATVTFDPSEDPKIYDLVRDDGFLYLKDIYTWDGDKIMICSVDNQGNRLTVFETKPGSKNRIRLWQAKEVGCEQFACSVHVRVVQPIPEAPQTEVAPPDPFSGLCHLP